MLKGDSLAICILWGLQKIVVESWVVTWELVSSVSISICRTTPGTSHSKLGGFAIWRQSFKASGPQLEKSAPRYERCLCKSRVNRWSSKLANNSWIVVQACTCFKKGANYLENEWWQSEEASSPVFSAQMSCPINKELFLQNSIYGICLVLKSIWRVRRTGVAALSLSNYFLERTVLPERLGIGMQSSDVSLGCRRSHSRSHSRSPYLVGGVSGSGKRKESPVSDTSSEAKRRRRGPPLASPPGEKPLKRSHTCWQWIHESIWT